MHCAQTNLAWSNSLMIWIYLAYLTYPRNLLAMCLYAESLAHMHMYTHIGPGS